VILRGRIPGAFDLGLRCIAKDEATGDYATMWGPEGTLWYVFSVIVTLLTIVVVVSIPIAIIAAIGYVIYSVIKNWRRS
jgi:hypothetical protein